MVLSNRTHPKLHNAMWPGLVGKGAPGAEPPISLERMLELTAAAEVNGHKFDGVDLFLFLPHFDIDATDDQVTQLADRIAEHSLAVGSLVAPVWAETGGGSAMGDVTARDKFLDAVRKACRIGERLNRHGVRQYGMIRIDSATPVTAWAQDPLGNTKKIAQTFRDAADIAAHHGERLVAEGEICWGGMHSWKYMCQLLELADRPRTLGFQADMAHTFLYLLGYNAPEHELLQPDYNLGEFSRAYDQMVHLLRPWTLDVHIAQNDGTVKGEGTHDKTGRHCLPDDPHGKLDIVSCAKYWLDGAERRGISHICWDGCMFPNAVLEDQATWDKVLATMIQVREAHGWQQSAAA